MDSVIDFIKNFDFSEFSLGFWDLLIAFGVIVITFVIGNKLMSFLRPETAQTTRRVLTLAFYSVFFAIQLFIVLNAILTERYDRLQLAIIVAALPYLRYWVGRFYKRYDKLVDKLTK